MKVDKMKGVVTALVTPFKNGKVDFVSLKKLVRVQLDAGVQGFVVNGTTAESPTLLADEVTRIFKTVRDVADGSVPLILGAGSNSTAQTILNMKAFGKLKPDAFLIVVPYYNKPPQQGLREHFAAVAKASKCPVILYNVPGRTVISMAADTVGALSKIKNIIGIKEASGKLDLLKDIQTQVPKNFLLSSGDDGSCIDFMLAGGHGVVSVISHVIPKELVQLSSRARSGDQTVRADYARFAELNRLMGVEPNPIPVKMALFQMGIIRSPEMRLPLVRMTAENSKLLAQQLKTLGLKTLGQV